MCERLTCKYCGKTKCDNGTYDHNHKCCCVCYLKLIDMSKSIECNQRIFANLTTICNICKEYCGLNYTSGLCENCQKLKQTVLKNQKLIKIILGDKND